MSDTPPRPDRPVAIAGPFLLAAALIALRNPAAVFRAEFWAEDGTEFFRAALAHGVASLWMAVYGYFMTLGRVIAWCATFFPVLWTTFVYAAATLAVNAFTLAYFSRSGFAWIVESRRARILVCALLAFAPGTGEVFLNLSNLTNCLALLAILMLIEKPHRLSWGKFAALMGIGLSSGHMVILLPLVLFLAWRARDRRYVFLALGLLPSVLANAVGNHRSGVDTGYLDYSKLLLAPYAVLKNFVARLLFAPFLGPHETNLLMEKGHALFWILGAAGIAGLIWVLRRTRYDREAAGFLGLSYTLVVGTFGIIVVSRAYNADLVLKNMLWDIRYSFMPGALATMFWMSLFLAWWWRERGSRRSLAAAGLAGMVLIAGTNLRRWDKVPERPDADWPESARSIQAVLDQRARGDLETAREIGGIRMHPVGTKFEWLTVTIPPSGPSRAR